MLLDVLLARDGIDASAIAGYERIEFMHLAAAALVAEGSADCGLGILAAARALGCDFVPLAEEPYELALDATAARRAQDRGFARRNARFGFACRRRCARGLRCVLERHGALRGCGAVTLELFGMARALTGRAEIALDVGEPCTLRALLRELLRVFPVLAGTVLDREYAAPIEPNAVLLDGRRVRGLDEPVSEEDRPVLLLIPSGG